MSKKKVTKSKLRPTIATSASKTTEVKDIPKVQNSENDLLFGKKNYMFILIGFGLMLLGFLLMSGGSMPSPDVWDESIIYSFRRTVLAPIVILVGLALQVVAIFKK